MQWFCSEVSTPPPFGKLSHLYSSGKGAVFLILRVFDSQSNSRSSALFSLC